MARKSPALLSVERAGGPGGLDCGTSAPVTRAGRFRLVDAESRPDRYGFRQLGTPTHWRLTDRRPDCSTTGTTRELANRHPATRLRPDCDPTLPVPAHTPRRQPVETAGLLSAGRAPSSVSRTTPPSRIPRHRTPGCGAAAASPITVSYTNNPKGGYRPDDTASRPTTRRAETRAAEPIRWRTHPAGAGHRGRDRARRWTGDLAGAVQQLRHRLQHLDLGRDGVVGRKLAKRSRCWRHDRG